MFWRVKKEANPLVWGAIAAIVAAGIWTATRLAGMPPSDNPLLRNPSVAAYVMFFWGYIAAVARNAYGRWVNRR